MCYTTQYVLFSKPYLISEYIKSCDADTAGKELSEFFSNYCPPEEYDGLIHKYNSRFENVLQLAKIIVDSKE